MKIYGPEGIGALWQKCRVSLRIRIEADAWRSARARYAPGTLPVHQIVGMGEVFTVSRKKRWRPEMARLRLRNRRLWNGIIKEILKKFT
ncbi:hypothetical protein KCP73_20010 [Salmonella enterica subsp. enterica]|nr:hypothetical protein KCP73_20010 [Salmonella enterica subsp. enterica]